MRGVGTALVALVLCALAGCTAGPGRAGPAASGPRAERPTYQLGDRWVRDDGLYELIRIEDDRYALPLTRVAR